MPKSTKNEIMSTLAELLRAKRLDDITVTELVERCGISRQAFYYHFSDLYGVVEYGIQQFMEGLEVPSPEQWRAAMEQTLTLLRENRTVVLNVYRAYERSYVEHDVRQWAAPLVEARTRMAAAKYNVTEDQVGFMTEVLTQALASIVLSWVERGMPSSVIKRMDDFDILVEGCLDYTMERLAQKNKG
ncbi:MAG: TetR/AcrR family transcriptional regulator [Clostridiales bacterium]|nr:TetR/AcrR family transcriptional regulator [Clostridiales bacterium]